MVYTAQEETDTLGTVCLFIIYIITMGELQYSSDYKYTCTNFSLYFFIRNNLPFLSLCMAYKTFSIISLFVNLIQFKKSPGMTIKK